MFLARCAGVAQLVEHLPSKQDVASSNLVARSSDQKRICPCGSVVEHSLGKGEVAGPIPAMGTIWCWVKGTLLT